MGSDLVFGQSTTLITSKNLISGEDLKKNSARGVEKIVYKNTVQGELKVHIFHAAPNTIQNSALILFHGGGFNSGSPQQFYPQARYLADFGITVICAEYRIKNKHKTTREYSVMDAKSAVRWVYQNADELNISVDRIAVGGGSAGGYLASAVGIIEGFDDPEDDTSIPISPAALVLYNPGLELSLKGRNNNGRAKGRKNESTLLSIEDGYPPSLVLIGTEDWLTPISKVESFCHLVKEAGSDCMMTIYDQQEHGFFNSKRNLYDTTIRSHRFLADQGLMLPPK
tara:strand:+ start:122 stop:970 length:849 start_codon:yes stop_codon:yes gene_type:complete